MNPLWLAITGFLVLVFFWSGGHTAWLIVLGVWIVFSVGLSAIEMEKAKAARRRRGRW